MEQKNDKIDVLLKSLIKMGELPPDDRIIDYLIDNNPERVISNAVRKKTIARLEKRQIELKETKKRLQSPEKLNSIGEYLILTKIKEQSDTHDFATKIQIDPKKLMMLEDDRISPLAFTPDEMARLICSISLRAQIAIELIRRSYQLFKLQPQLGKASARYDDRSGMPESKIGDMDRALKELILKSHVGAGKAETTSDPEIENYLKKLQEKLG
ncbi:MAG: hypothetical protein J7M30_09205 [Deltaproteobacteria bacterium]|nr:hypothetical protein [Deltaproteobacteria bacterium]